MLIPNCIGKTGELTSPGRSVSVMTEQGLGLARRLPNLIYKNLRCKFMRDASQTF